MQKSSLSTLICLAIAAAASITANAAPYQFNSPFTEGGQQGQAPAPANVPEGQVEGLTGPQNTFWRREHMTGEWDEFRNQMLYKGFAITPIWQGEVFGNWGGAKQGVIADGVFNIALDMDLERITGFWKDAVIHANAMYIYGSSLSAKYVGDFSNTSNLAGYNTVRLQEIWLQQNFWQKRASIRIGMIAADTEFFTSDSAGLFLNGTLGAFTLIGSNFVNAPIYPVSSPGVLLSIAPTSKVYVKAAAFGMDSNSDPADNNNHGTHFHINSQDGGLYMFEVGFLLNQSPNDRGLIGTYKLGTFFQQGNDYTTWQSQASDALGTGSLSGRGTNYAVYGVADQEIYKHGGQVISAFVRAGFAPSRYSFVDRYIDGGFNFTGFIPGRPQDVAGIAVAHSSISNSFSDSQVAQGGDVFTSETVIEATYRVVVAPWCSIQPDLQYIVNPSGVKGSRDAFVIGVRTTLAF